MDVRKVMTADVVTIAPAESCHEALQRMVRHRVRHLPVVEEDGTLVGIVTDRDLRHYLFTPEVFERLGEVDVLSLLGRARVGGVMSAPAVTTDANADITEAVRVMCQRKVGSLPVLDGEELVGILTETNLLKEIVRSDTGCGPEVTVIVSYP
jgi:acetoin utilization protein AcuB